MMEYRDFIENVRTQISDHLPEKYKNSQIELSSVIKNNDTVLDALLIKCKESNTLPSIYLNDYYKEYQQGRSFASILERIAEIRVEADNMTFDISDIVDFEKAKEHIFCRLINMEQNRQYLLDKPYQQMEDLAVVYHIMLENTVNGTATVPINKGILQEYGISPETLHQTALENMKNLSTARFYSMEDVLKDMVQAGMIPEVGTFREEKMELPEGMMYVLTNESKTFGAAEVLNRDVMDDIAAQLGERFYVLPSSVHEVLVIPKSSGFERKELETMVWEVNQRAVLPEEILSDHIYEYDAAKRELCRSDRMEEQQKGVLEQEKQNDEQTKSMRRIKKSK